MDHLYKIHNDTGKSCCDYSSSTIYTMLGIMLFISCYPPIHIMTKQFYKDCKDKCKLYKLNIRRLNSTDDLLLDECSICLEKYDKKDKIIDLECNHVFHKECIKLWLNKNNSCPQCRDNII